MGVAGLVLTACTTITDPVPVGPDTYMIGLGSNGGFSSDAALMAKTIKAAGAFCASKGKQIEVQDTKQHGVQMWTPQSNQVTFKCI